MAKWIGIAVLALMLMTGDLATIASAVAAPVQTEGQSQKAKASGISVRRHVRHHDRFAYRSYDPVYYDRPYYYAPAPFFPFLGIGYGPWW